jgi:hypothetical protein
MTGAAYLVSAARTPIGARESHGASGAARR